MKASTEKERLVYRQRMEAIRDYCLDALSAEWEPTVEDDKRAYLSRIGSGNV